MAKWRCVCGEVIRSSGDIPNPIEWHAIRDTDVERFFASGEPGEVSREIAFGQLAVFVFRCPVSDHLWVFWDGIGESPTLYGPQSFPWTTSDEQ